MIKGIKGDVAWYVNGKKKPIAWSTRATSDLIAVLAENCDTFHELLDCITYDIEAKNIVQKYIDLGYRNKDPKSMFIY